MDDEQDDVWYDEHPRVVAWMKHITPYDALEILHFATQCQRGVWLPATLMGAIQGIIERKGIDSNDL
jgi:hypothetical protein